MKNVKSKYVENIFFSVLDILKYFDENLSKFDKFRSF